MGNIFLKKNLQFGNKAVGPNGVSSSRYLGVIYLCIYLHQIYCLAQGRVRWRALPACLLANPPCPVSAAMFTNLPPLPRHQETRAGGGRS